MIENKKELLEFVKKVKSPNIEPCSTVLKGKVAFYGEVPTICTPTVMCNYDDVGEVKSILRTFKATRKELEDSYGGLMESR